MQIIKFTCSIIGVLTFSVGLAQPLELVQKKGVVFSAVSGMDTKPDTIQVPAKQGLLTAADVWMDGDGRENFKVLSLLTTDAGSKLVIAFRPAPGLVGIVHASLRLGKANEKNRTVVPLTGLATKGLEGENEPPLWQVASALGYTVNVGWTTLANHSRPEQMGDEVGTGLFKKAGKGNIEILPVARYSPDFELPFGYYIHSSDGPVKHQAGVLAKSGAYPEHQTLFPAMASGSILTDPGEHDFGFYTTGPTHTAYSEDVWNMALHPANAVRATRTYPVKDKDGRLLKNTFLVCYEEAKNGDYNDYVFLVKNIMPVIRNRLTTIFNGKDLKGWHIFLKDIPAHTDPNKNFRIEDGALHVIGKDLGYAITDKGYSNYHLKVDFKWGVTKWPPRENAKRDGGICYNIPVSEPDSIWPQSVECQIQEGDVGDFWLLGFSTIEVDGKVNKPSDHTQVIKKKDNENPYGEWNTVEVISYKGTCIHIVNGVVVNVGDHVSTKEGRILLQSEFSEIYYRKVQIEQL
jgi:hypothetical protein